MRSTLLGELHFALHLTPFALPFLEGLLKYSLEATPIPRKKHALLSARYPQKPARPQPDPRRPREKIKAMREVKPSLGSTFGNRTGDRGWAALATNQWNFAVNQEASQM
jgi:hypothetical protein